MFPKADYLNGEDIKTFNMKNKSTKKSDDLIDFGFVKYSNGYSTGLKFVPNKMMKDMAYIHEEVVMDMFINPLFENESDSQQEVREENESYDSYEQHENSKQKKSRFSFRRNRSKRKSKSSIRVVTI